MKVASLIAIYLVGTALAYILGSQTSWLLSFLFGPMEHLGLAINQVNNGSQYMDGQARVSQMEYLEAFIKAMVWIIGGVAFVLLLRGKPQTARALILGVLWISVGIANICLFAIRSV